jgi:hypothetical protein
MAREEMRWVEALDEALSEPSSHLQSRCSCVDPILEERARQYAIHDGDVLLSDHDTTALFVGSDRKLVCLNCIKARIENSEIETETNIKSSASFWRDK